MIFKIWVVNFVMDFLITCCKYSCCNLLIDPSHLGEKVKDLFSGTPSNSPSREWLPPVSDVAITNIDILIRNINIILRHLRPKDSTHHYRSVHDGDSEEEPPLRLVWRGSLLSDALRFLGVLRERSARQVSGGERQWHSDPRQWWLRTAELDQHQQRNPQWPFRRLRWGEKDPLFCRTLPSPWICRPCPLLGK